MLDFEKERSRKDRFSVQYPDFSLVQKQMKAFLTSHPKMRWKELADRAGLDASTISKYKTGQCKSMHKSSAIRLAVAMELDWEQMELFVHAAGYAFPRDELDYAIQEIFMKNQGRSIRYYEFLYSVEDNPIFRTFLNGWFG